MRVILQIVSGPDAGCRVLLRPGQRLRVGRSEWADFPVPGDGHLSKTHFELEADHGKCTVADLGSSNGTLVNGEPLCAQAALADGDRIRAGHTDFVVCIEGAAVPPTAAAPSERNAAPPAGRNGRVACSVQVGQTGLLCCRGGVEDITPRDLVARLSAQYPLYLAVDFNRVGLPAPEGISEPTYLLPWLSEEKRTTFSPIILSAADEVDLMPLVEAGWGKDGLIALFSAAAPADILHHLERFGSAFVRPSILTAQLERDAQHLSQPLLERIDAVLLEDGGPDRWAIFAAAEMGQTLDEVGFKKTPSGA